MLEATITELDSVENEDLCEYIAEVISELGSM
jgi:hypothetical protein